MSKGGYRPGAGRPKGIKETKPRRRKGGLPPPEPTEAEKIEKMLSYGTRAKAKLYQDYLQRIGQGGALSVTEKKHMDKLGAELEAEIKGDEPPDVNKLDLEAYDYLRQVWNDPSIEVSLRIRAAEIVFKGAEEKRGKKDEKADRAKAAGSGKFAASKPPMLKVVSK
jgi:hypothetical protein